MGRRIGVLLQPVRVRRSCRRLAAVLSAVVLVVLTAGCQVDIAVGVTAKADGSGRVRVTATLDKEAAAAMGTLALDDLRRTGWTVEGPRATADGGAVVVASHGFRDGVEAGRLLGEVAGPDGALAGITLSTKRSLLHTSTSFDGTVDLSTGLNGFGDADLRRRLGGPGIGLDPAAVEQATGIDLEHAFALSVAVELPGSLTSTNAPARAGGRAEWRPALGQKIVLHAAASHWNGSAIAFLVVATIAALAALVLLIRGFRQRQPHRSG